MKNRISLFFKLIILLLSLYFIISEVYLLSRVNPNYLISHELFTYIYAFKVVLIFMALPAFWIIKILDYFEALPEETALFESQIFYKSMSFIVSVLIIISLIQSFLK